MKMKNSKLLVLLFSFVFLISTAIVNPVVSAVNGTQLSEADIKSTSDEDYQSLHAQAIANNLRGLDHFDGLANDLLRSHFEEYDYIENLNSIQNMKIEQVHAYIKDLDFSHSCVTKILPNDSI